MELNLGKNKNGLGAISWMIAVTALILFACSSLRHTLFQSTAYDLGIFDQAIYLISQGKEPITTIQGFHILGDHAAWIHYILALPYKIYPSVYWLFIVQSLALALGALPTWYLVIQAGLKESQAMAVATAYLLYPVVYNANLFDFHPEVIAVPLLLSAVLAARLENIAWFCVCIILTLGCKAVLSLTVVAMGIGLMLFEKKRLCGLLAIILGSAWFIIATKLIIPAFSGAEAAAVGRYSYLGNSVFEIAKNLIFQPGLIFSKIFSLDNFGYLILLSAPIIWGLSTASLKPLIGAIPCVALNLIADYQAQKDLVHQYTLPALPFLILAVIASLAVGKGLLQNKRGIIIWSLITFLCLAKFTHFTGKYLESIDNLQATREAISLVKNQGSVYTTAQITPHLSNRDLIKFTNADFPNQDLNIFDYILLNVRHPGWASNQEFATSLVNQLNNKPRFKLTYQQDDIYLFTKN
ncbi:DUF2079 domain-containing protein [Dolichospermum circinale]|uniref:DUF2079 domain-containing protein n=1 Tax=Dolichospermum circinale TaxID=109265 RepID=UPI00232C75A4|nr:DUF2079 domain-containing protein [Dolichospermum circinale]MDB9456815.1 DUF2079 domain-containing protein [Dolichospermum circinale CS-541/06]MDB9461799.1 DUF2079 domain-containing protein [Dolichospermum circinale CS-541/04]MDB9549212.1 DUF2079 domain-containing protein [Dolichospermum circinale CS-1031]